MIRLFKIKVPRHTYGRGYSFDLANSYANEFCTGAFAFVKDGLITEQDQMEKTRAIQLPWIPFFQNRNIAKVSISTDGEKVVHPILPLASKLPIKATANKMMQPVDFVQLGNKITVVIEEFQEAHLIGKQVEYTLSVYIKTTKRRKELCCRR